MMNTRLLLLSFIALLAGTPAGAQYLETFSTPSKGYLPNFVDDFTGVNWTLSAWEHQPPAAFGRDVDDYFQTTAAGVLECIDIDNEVCWESPLINIAAAGAVSLSVDLVWNGFDTDQAANPCVTGSPNATLDYIKVEYSLDGGPFMLVPNQVGGAACATIGYASGGAGGNGSATVTQNGLTGASIRIRVCVGTNANAEIVQIDNVSIPQAGVTLNCTPPTLSATSTNIVCGGPNSGAIDLTATGGAGGYTYDWSNDGAEDPDNDAPDLSGLAAGTYTVTVTDAAACSQTTTVTILSTPIVQNAFTFPASCGLPNGAIDLSVSGGNPGYGYSWTGGATTQDLGAVAAGVYTVTVTDQSVPACTSTATYLVGVPIAGPYTETFSVPGKGYLINQVDDFLGMNWSLSPWTLDEPPSGAGRDNGDYFQTTAAGQLEAVDADQEICWISPEFNIAGAGATEFSVDLGWAGFDNEDYILVEYSLDGGAFVTVPNAVGGGVGTIQYPFPSIDQSGAATVTATGLSGNKLRIKICLLTNAQAETVQIDNVSIPQTVSLYCPPSSTEPEPEAVRLNISPNPADDEVLIDAAALPDNSRLVLTALADGRVVWQYTTAAPQAIRLDTAGLNEGVYVLSVRNPRGIVISEKLLILHR